MAGGTRPAWPRGDRKALGIAVLVSVVAHALLLVTWRLQRESAPREPALVVTLVGAVVAPAVPKPAPQPAAPPEADTSSGMPPATPALPAASSVPAAAVPATPALPAASSVPAAASAAAPDSPSEAPAPAAAAAAASTPVTTASAAARETPPAPALARSEPEGAPPAQDAITFHPAAELSRAPVPQSTPDGDQLAAAKLVGRRLLFTLSIDAGGQVRKAVVMPYELDPATMALLEKAIAAVRFQPGEIDGHPVAAQVNSRLCFNDAGVLDTTSPGCWHFDAKP